MNRNQGEEIEVEVVPVDIETIWKSGRTGVYSLTDWVFDKFGERYEANPRILVTGPAAQETDMGGIMSVPITNGKISYVDTWPGTTVYTAFNRRGWMVPNQYWVSGVLPPMAIMGKYHMIYSYDFIPPRTLGRMCAERMKKELILDNLGICRFHRGWAEEMLPEVIGSLYNCKEQFYVQSMSSPVASTVGTALSSGNLNAISITCTHF